MKRSRIELPLPILAAARSPLLFHAFAKVVHERLLQVSCHNDSARIQVSSDEDTI